MGLSFSFMHLVFWLSLFFLTLAHFTSPMHSLCHENERSTLLQFKESLTINKSASADSSAYSKIASWKAEEEDGDCCSWDGITCHKVTGHVIKLDLTSSYLYGSINSSSSLFHLVHLEWLSLADNNFNGSKVPSGIMKLMRLSYLDLSLSVFSGQAPAKILELSKLVYLDLSRNHLSGSIPPSLGNLTKIRYLYLSENEFSGELPASIGNLSALEELGLSQNTFSGSNTRSLSWIAKLNKLTYLGLSEINLVGEIPCWLMNLTRLTQLHMSHNNLTGPIPFWLMNQNQLVKVILSSNRLIGHIPFQIGNLTQLRFLALGSNQLQGPIPSSLFDLGNLLYLHLGSNNLSGTVDLDVILHKLKNLKIFILSSNNLSLLSKPSFYANLQQIAGIGLRSCNLVEFPNFLLSQNQMELLDLSSNKIAGRIPGWFLNSSIDTLVFLNLSNNLLTGFDQYPVFLPWTQINSLDLRFNKLQGPIFPIPPVSISFYLVSHNNLTGKIPSFLCNLNRLEHLDLSHNNLSGKLPQCLGNFSYLLSILNLQKNNFYGSIPQTFMNGTNLKMIDLSHNVLHGRIPRSLANCTELEFLDLGNNKINDTFPSWLETLPKLKVLILQSNRLSGVIGEPNTDYAFRELRVIDISFNRFTGNLPSKYFESWHAMKVANASRLTYMQDLESGLIVTGHHEEIDGFPQGNYDYSLQMSIKGIELEYGKISNILTAIVFSSNRFVGEIPESIANLRGLHFLVLSNNDLFGRIPLSMGNLTALESLDISNNRLSGQIPQQLAELTFLAFFNVSHNHLTGPIPQGHQFDTFENNSFYGNPGLCGKQIEKKCENIQASKKEDPAGSDSPFEFDWKISLIGYASGLIVGVVIGQSFVARKQEWIVKILGADRKRM